MSQLHQSQYDDDGDEYEEIEEEVEEVEEIEEDVVDDAPPAPQQQQQQVAPAKSASPPAPTTPAPPKQSAAPAKSPSPPAAHESPPRAQPNTVAAPAASSSPSASPAVTRAALSSTQPPQPTISRRTNESEEYEEYEEEVEEEYEEDEEVDDEEEEEEEEEDEEVEEQENMLKYVTFPIGAVKGHHIMTLAAYDRFIFVGTNTGLVVLLDAGGQEMFRFENHLDPITDICCDAKEEFFAVSDKAGVISAQNIFERHDFFKKEFDHPIQTIAIHPRYGSMDDRPVVCGGGDKLLLITKGLFLGNRKTTTIQERNGKVHAVRWCGDLIAWANDRGVSMYSFTSKTIFASFPRPADSPKPELYRCCLMWENECTLLCGWADWYQQFKVKETKLEDRVKKNEFTKTLKADVECGFRTSLVDSPYRICGVAPFGKEMLLFLTCTIDGNMEGHMKDLEVRLVDRKSFGDVFRGTMHMKHKHQLLFSMAYFPTDTLIDSTYYVVSMDSVIKATPCDDDDHVEHLLRMQQYQEAFDFARSKALKRRSTAEIGRNLLDHLVSRGEYERAATQFDKTLGNDAEEWERWISLYDQREQSDLLVKYLPVMVQGTVHGPRIKKEFYELVLNRCLEKDIVVFKSAVNRFEGLYEYETVGNAVESKYNRMKRDKMQGKTINEREMLMLGETYATLLEKQDKFNDALSILMEIKRSTDLFTFIKKNNLWAKAYDILPELFEKSAEQTILLLLDHIKGEDASELSPLSPEAIVKRLENQHRDQLWKYIKGVQKSDRGAYQQMAKKHAQLFATLFADHEPAGMLGFLKEMSMHLTKTKEIHALCKQRGLLEEMVFLMARMGKQDEGLRIIVEEMKNVEKAINFIKDFPSDEDQIELFKKLIDLVQVCNSKMQGKGDNKYFDHMVQDGESWLSIAAKYSVKESELRNFNGAGTAAASTLPRPSIRVPMNMLAALLTAVSDPSVSEQTAIDPILLIKVLPPEQHIPNIGESLARIARSKAGHRALMETLMRVLNGDIGELQHRLYRGRARAIRVDPRSRFCYYCNEHCIGTSVLTFSCTHTYHPKCVVDYSLESGALKPEWGSFENPDKFLNDPQGFLKNKTKKIVPTCARQPRKRWLEAKQQQIFGGHESILPF